MKWLEQLLPFRTVRLKPNPKYSVHPQLQKLVVTAECLESVTQGIEEERERRREGILYLLGLVDASTTVMVGSVQPRATTTASSFDVSSQAMADVVRTASRTGLYVVGQLHTHPRHAYHSTGDETGARIRFSGFTSIVVPSYGDRLPDLTGIIVFVIDHDGTFQPFDASELVVLPRGALWRI